jgi:hypothetical protein
MWVFLLAHLAEGRDRSIQNPTNVLKKKGQNCLFSVKV